MRKISNKQMSKVQGGVSGAEYCATLSMIMTHNPITDDMLAAYGRYCTAIRMV